MTKRFSAIWALAAAATLLLLASCGEKLPDPAIDIPTTEDLAPAFTRDGGSTTVAFHSATDWTVSVNVTKAGEWISVSPTSGKAGDAKITITVQENQDSEAREATVTIKSGAVSKDIKVSQESGRVKDPDWYSKLYWQRTEREKAGFFGPVKTVRYTSHSPSYALDYDKDGHLVQERHYKSPGDEEPLDVYYHKYDENGRRIRTATYPEGTTPGVGAIEILYEYGNGDKLVNLASIYGISSTIDPRGGGYQCAHFEKDIFVGLSSRKYWSYNTVSTWVYTDETFEFGEDGKLTVNTQGFATAAYAPQDGERFGEVNYQTVWEYDGIYPVASKTPDGDAFSYTWQNNGMPATLTDPHGTVEYAENPRYVLPNAFGTIRFNDYWDVTFIGSKDGDYEEKYSEYKYDAQGNWVSMHMNYKNGAQNGGSTYLREITYYQ